MMQILDTTAIAKITNQEDMDEFVASLGLLSPTIIIKPNWVDAMLGTHTDAKILDLLFTSLKSKKIILIESYTFWRTDKMTAGKGDYFSSKEANFETGKPHWDHFKKQDQWFLSYTGIDKIIAKHKATYINVTNELWQENSQELVPKKILDLKGSDFISLAKLKGDADYGATLAIKNLFGLYPDPHRMKKYHGDDDRQLLQNIIKVNQTYQKLFKCFFVVEGVFTASHVDWGGKGLQSFENLGVIIGGKDAMEVDSTALKLMGRQFTDVLTNLLPEYQVKIGGHLQTQDIPHDYQINFPNL